MVDTLTEGQIINPFVLSPSELLRRALSKDELSIRVTNATKFYKPVSAPAGGILFFVRQATRMCRMQKMQYPQGIKSNFLPKKSIQKKSALCRLFPAFLRFDRVCRKGFPYPSSKLRHPCRNPSGYSRQIFRYLCPRGCSARQKG